MYNLLLVLFIFFSLPKPKTSNLFYNETHLIRIEVTYIFFKFSLKTIPRNSVLLAMKYLKFKIFKN